MNLRQLNQILLQTLLVPVVAMIFVAAVLALQIRNAERTVELMRKAGDNIATATRVSALIVDEETGVRGYQLTDNEIFLQPYTFAEAPLHDALRDLRAGLVQQGSDPRLVDNVIQAHETWQIAFAEPLIIATQNDIDTHDAGLNLRAKAQMDHVRALIDEIIESQKIQRTQTVETWQHQVHQTLEILVILTLVIGLAIGISARNRLHLVSDAFQRTLDSQRRAQTALLATEKLAVAGRLAATLAHEIHNPLDAVSNLLYLLKDGTTPEETQQFLDLANNELARVTQISRAILGMYRESKQPVAVNIQDMLSSILLLLDPQMKQAQLDIRTHFTPRAMVFGFPAQLRQVFINLLTNAAEASTPGSSIEILSALHPATATNPAGVVVTVSDHGSGVDPETLPKLFQPFFTTKGENGTGLGLWVSKGIIEKHDGSIAIESQTQSGVHGTTVTVFLPRGEATPNPTP